MLPEDLGACRRRRFHGDDLKRLRKLCEAGKPNGNVAFQDIKLAMGKL